MTGVTIVIPITAGWVPVKRNQNPPSDELRTPATYPRRGFSLVAMVAKEAARAQAASRVPLARAWPYMVNHGKRVILDLDGHAIGRKSRGRAPHDLDMISTAIWCRTKMSSRHKYRPPRRMADNIWIGGGS